MCGPSAGHTIMSNRLLIIDEEPNVRDGVFVF